MPTNAFVSVLSSSALSAAWRSIFTRASPRARKTTGVDDISIDDFRADEKGRLNRLTRDLRQAEFRFDRLRPHLIPKANGKDRLICVPTVRDRIVQRALLEFLSTRYADKLANKVSYGFIKQRGVKKAASDACKLRALYPWVFKTDITSFFDRIDRDRLCDALRKCVRERSLHTILSDAVRCEIQPVSGGAERRIRRLGIVPGSGLRQGMPLSPFFSNVMLGDFDKTIEKRGFRAVRYADDLVFFSASREDCLTLASFCAEELGRIGLEVPPIEQGSKSVIYAPAEAAEFLGVCLSPSNGSYRIELARTQIERIRDELLALGSVDELVSREILLPRLGYILAIRRSGYLAAYDVCENVGDLDRELSAIEQRVLRKIYEGLGINLAKLSGISRKFLGLHDR
jgi:RNA-directed DNA polymerase